MRHESILMGRLKFIRPESPQCFGSPSEEKKIPKTKLGTLPKNSFKVPQKRDYLTISIGNTSFEPTIDFQVPLVSFRGCVPTFLFASGCGCVSASNDKKGPWLVRLYRGLYYPII